MLHDCGIRGEGGEGRRERRKGKEEGKGRGEQNLERQAEEI